MKTWNELLSFPKRGTARNQLRDYLKVIFLWCPIVTILFIFGFGGFDQLTLRFSISMLIAATVATWCFAGSMAVNFIYNSYRRKQGRGPKQGAFWGILTSFPFLLPGLYFGFLLAAKFSEFIGRSFNAPKFTDYSSGVIFGILVSGLFTLFEVVRESKEQKQLAEVKLQALENEKLKAQVSALTAQMNPHLLFNSLNTIASTITTDPTSAEDMVVKLSELYRGILKSAKGDMHSLENELLLCKSYLEIEKKRFGSRISYNIEIDDTLDISKVQIPVLLLQPLIENAVKHGISPKKEGGTISISIQKNETSLGITVIDNGVGIDFNKPTSGTGTGVSNCEARIKLKYGEGSHFSFGRNENNETAASIRLPLKAVVND